MCYETCSFLDHPCTVRRHTPRWQQLAKGCFFKRNNIISTWYSYWHGTLVLHFPELELCLTTSIKHFKDLINAYFMYFLWLVWFGTDGLVSVYYCLVWTAKTQVSFINKWSLLPTDFYWLFILWLVHLMSNKSLGTIS